MDWRITLYSDVTVNYSSGLHMCAWPAVPWGPRPISSHWYINMQFSSVESKRVQRAGKGANEPDDRRMFLFCFVMFGFTNPFFCDKELSTEVGISISLPPAVTRGFGVRIAIGRDSCGELRATSCVTHPN